MKKRNILMWFLICSCLQIWAKTYVVSVGISNYEREGVSRLNNPENDARDFAAFYNLGGANVCTILGRAATRSNIITKLSETFSQAGEKDKIVFFFSGHGAKGIFATFGTGTESRLSYSDVLDIMKKSSAKAKYIFADACHTGAIRNGTTTTERRKDPVMFFLSSRGNEVSNDLGPGSNGLFTKYLLKALKGFADTDYDMKITAIELFRYVSENVARSSSDEQHPVMWGNFNDDLVIVEYRPRN